MLIATLVMVGLEIPRMARPCPASLRSELDTPILARPAEPALRLDVAAAWLAGRAGAIGSLLVLLVAWEVAARSGAVTPFLLPPLQPIIGRES